MRMKKRFMACALLVILLSFITHSTLAYFTTEATARNVITSGKIDVTLAEKTDTGADFEDVDGVMPGQNVSKIVYVENADDAADAWVRIKCDITVDGIAPEEVSEAITLDYDTENWTKQDGYWYYNSALKTGEKTSPLFTTVTFSTGMGNEYQGCSAVINVQAQATQVANNGTTVLEALGWPE